MKEIFTFLHYYIYKTQKKGIRLAAGRGKQVGRLRILRRDV